MCLALDRAWAACVIKHSKLRYKNDFGFGGESDRVWLLRNIVHRTHLCIDIYIYTRYSLEQGFSLFALFDNLPLFCPFFFFPPSLSTLKTFLRIKAFSLEPRSLRIISNNKFICTTAIVINIEQENFDRKTFFFSLSLLSRCS